MSERLTYGSRDVSAKFRHGLRGCSTGEGFNKGLVSAARHDISCVGIRVENSQHRTRRVFCLHVAGHGLSVVPSSRVPTRVQRGTIPRN